MIVNSRTIQSTPESGNRAGYDRAKKRKGSKVHSAVDTLGNMLAMTVTAASEQDRTQVATLATAVQEATGGTMEGAYADQGYTGTTAAEQAQMDSFRCSCQHRAYRGGRNKGRLGYSGRWSVPNAATGSVKPTPAATAASSRRKLRNALEHVACPPDANNE